MPPNSTDSRLRADQLESLNGLVREILPANRFYTRKLGETAALERFESLTEYQRLFPFTSKQELVHDQQAHPLYGQNLTYPIERYTRLNQTSGTSGKPLRWLDTSESWNALIDCWVEVHEAAGVTASDAAYFAFSFGPFLGFWLAFEAAGKIGCLCIPGGGLSSLARLKNIIELNATVLCCTPTYAIHLGEVAQREKLDLARSKVRVLLVAGEPGGSLPATRAHIERLWPGARVFDHHGMTETGPVTYECPAHPCRLHVIDRAYFAEVIDPKTLLPIGAESDGTGELVLTTLVRAGSPLLRYRTGDLVRVAAHSREGRACACGRFETALEGGIIGRVDDMVVVRGVNVYPSAIEEIIRQFSAITEYQVEITRSGAMTEMHVRIEPAAGANNPAVLIEQVAKQLQTSLNLRVPVSSVPEGTLPRAELKARRWLRK